MLRRATVRTLQLGMFLALLIAAILSVGLLLVLVSYNNPASAQSTTAVPGTTITVNTIDDESNTDGDCSLREAIQAANPPNAAVDGCKAGSATERDAIHFSVGKEATIVLSSTLPTITDASGLTINGQKAKITVSGDNKVPVFLVDSGAKLNLNHLTVANGTAGNPSGSGGGLLNLGEVNVKNSTFSGNSAEVFGGGIENVGTLEVANSTFSGNSAIHRGGGIDSQSTLEVTNSTFSGNSGGVVGGGGINNDGTLTVTNSTLSGNSAGNGGGIRNFFGTTATLKNTIVANSTSGGNCHNNDSAPVTDGGYNIEDGTSCGFDPNNNSMPSTEPKLASSLANNGGPTKTIRLLKGSPALGAIPKATNGCGTEIKRDQRGVNRPQGKKCDIGAFEKKRRR